MGVTLAFVSLQRIILVSNVGKDFFREFSPRL